MNRSLVISMAVVAAAAVGCNRTPRNQPPPVPSMPTMMPSMAVMPSGMPMMPSGMPPVPTGMPMMPSGMPTAPGLVGAFNQQMASAAAAMGSAAGQANQAMASAAGAMGQTITVGATVPGTLTATDQHLEDGSVGDDYNVMLIAGAPVTITAVGGPSMDTPGSNLDTYLLVLQGTTQLQTDDDSGGSLNARIGFTPPSNGMYTIRVTTYGAGLKQGAYTLTVTPGLPPPTPGGTAQ